MVGYPVEVEEGNVKASGIGLRISRKKAHKICEKINRNKMKLEEAKEFVQGLIDGEEDIKGKTYKSSAIGNGDVSFIIRYILSRKYYGNPP